MMRLPRWRWRYLFLILLAVYAVFLVSQFRPRNFSWTRKPLPVHVENHEAVTRVTKNFSYTESQAGRPVMSVTAEEVVAFKNTEYNLRNVGIVFYLKNGKVTLACREARFDVEAKDADVQGRVFIQMPNGFTLATEEMSYRHKTRELEGAVALSFTFMDFYWGDVGAVHMNLHDESFLMERVQAQGPDAWIQTPLLTGNMRSRAFSFPSGVRLQWKDDAFALDTLSLHVRTDGVDLLGTCLDGSLRLPDPALLHGENFTGQMSRRPTLAMRALQIRDGMTLNDPVAGREARSASAEITFAHGRLSAFDLKGDVYFRDQDQEANSATAVFTLGADRTLDSAYFGDGARGCVHEWYYSAETLQVLPKEKAAFLRGDVHTHSKGMTLDGAWVHVSEDGNKVEAGGGVYAQDDASGYKVRAADMDLNRAGKRTTFRKEVLAWSKANTLRARLLSFFNDRWQASGEVEVLYNQGSETLRLICWTLDFDTVHQVLDAVGSVQLQSATQLLAGYHLIGYQEKNQFTRLVLTDGVHMELKGEGKTGRGDALEANLKDNFFVLEGCPAELEDKKEGHVEAAIILGLRDPLQIFLSDEGGRARILHPQSEGKHINLTLPEKGKKKGS